MGEAVGSAPDNAKSNLYSIKKNSYRVHIEPGASFPPQVIANLLPPISGQHAFQLITRVPLVILITWHGRGLSFSGASKDIFDKA